MIRRCGKPTCHCAKSNDPGHDPQLRLTRKVAGKTITETFPNPVRLRKAQQGVAEFHRFQQLSEDLVGFTKRSLHSAPPSNNGAAGPSRKKTTAAIHQAMTREVNQLLSRIFAERRQSGQMHLEAVESAFRTALHQSGAAGLSELLQYEVPAAQQRQLPCSCGHHAQYQDLRSKPILTVLGRAGVSRPYYLCSQCHQVQFPADVELDIEHTELSPGERRTLALVGQRSSFRSRAPADGTLGWLRGHKQIAKFQNEPNSVGFHSPLYCGHGNSASLSIGQTARIIRNVAASIEIEYGPSAKAPLRELFRIETLLE